MGKERCPCAVRCVESNKAIEVDVENNVAAEQQEVFREVVHLKQRARRPQRLRLFKIRDIHAEFFTVSEIPLNRAAQMPDDEPNIGQSEGFKVFNLILQNRLSANFNHGFGNVAPHRRNARPFAACHYDCLHALLRKKMLFDLETERVIDRQMQFLNLICFHLRRDNRNVGKALEFAAVPA